MIEIKIKREKIAYNLSPAFVTPKITIVHIWVYIFPDIYIGV